MVQRDKSDFCGVLKNIFFKEMIVEECEKKGVTESKSKNDDRAKIFTNCFATAAMTIDRLHGNTLNSVSVMQHLIESAEKIEKGNIKEIEQMLMTQAKALDYIFYETLNKLVGLEMIHHLQVFTDVALKAQNQSRKTLVALAELKHPKRTTFIKQQNNAVNQQVNNEGKPVIKNSEKNKKVANELLEQKESIGIGSKAIINTNAKMEQHNERN